jgi:hypothetical protein
MPRVLQFSSNSDQGGFKFRNKKHWLDFGIMPVQENCIFRMEHCLSVTYSSGLGGRTRFSARGRRKDPRRRIQQNNCVITRFRNSSIVLTTDLGQCLLTSPLPFGTMPRLSQCHFQLSKSYSRRHPINQKSSSRLLRGTKCVLQGPMSE